VPHGERVRPLLGVNGRGQQRVLRWHQHGHSDPVKPGRNEALPRAVHPRKRRRATGRDNQAHNNGPARADAISQPTPNWIAAETGRSHRRQDQSGHAELDSPHLMQIDQEERQGQPLPNADSASPPRINQAREDNRGTNPNKPVMTILP
jgi:hypothetical protein